jgi:AcrR family transcriptional regulator
MHTVSGAKKEALHAADQGGTLGKGPRTRNAIIEAAAELFSGAGYEATSLEDIAAQLGMSRASVLFHFESKRALLMVILEPLFAELETLIASYEGEHMPLGPRRRRQLLAGYCDIVVEHRRATILLQRDLSTLTQMHWPAAGSELGQRMFMLLHGPDADRYLRLRVTSSIGGILRSVCVPPFDPAQLDADARQMIVNSALAAFNAPEPTPRAPVGS